NPIPATCLPARRTSVPGRPTVPRRSTFPSCTSPRSARAWISEVTAALDSPVSWARVARERPPRVWRWRSSRLRLAERIAACPTGAERWPPPVASREAPADDVMGSIVVRPTGPPPAAAAGALPGDAVEALQVARGEHVLVGRVGDPGTSTRAHPDAGAGRGPLPPQRGARRVVLGRQHAPRIGLADHVGRLSGQQRGDVPTGREDLVQLRGHRPGERLPVAQRDDDR